MSTPGMKLDRSPIVESQILAIVRELLDELGNRSAIETCTRAGLSAHLERDLGLGSLERVELLVRLDKAFSVHLPDSALSEADTVADLVEAVLVEAPAERASPKRTNAATSSGAAPAAIQASDQAWLRGIREAAESLTEILIARGRAEPDTAHIQIYEEDDRIRTITSGELLERAAAVGAGLTRRGLAPGQTVALMLPTSADFFFCFAGIWMAGGIPVPMYPPFRADRIEEYAARQEGILRNAEAKFLITFRQVESLARILGPRVPSLIDILDAAELASTSGPSAPPRSEMRPTDGHLRGKSRGEEIAFLQYTSGSTGDPKGVVLTHANLLANIRAIGESVKLLPTDVAVSWLPLYHDMGLIGAWFVPLCYGIPLYVMSPLAFLTRPERWLRAIHKHRGTVSPAPNFAYELCTRKIADADIEGLDLSCWRAALNGAEPVRAETMERFAARFERAGFRREALMPVYGLAEASLCVSAPAVGTGYKVDRIAREEFEREGRALPAAGAADANALDFVSAGTPIPGIEVKILDREGREAGERVEGRLLFRGASTTQGYYRNPAATKSLVQPDGWLDSGDLAYRANKELYITGRAKDIIIKGGRNLYPHEIEEVVGRVKGVRTGCVVAFGAPDQRSGTERFIVAAELREAGDRQRVASEINTRVSQAIGMPPDLIELLPPHSIPKTSSGKLRRMETRRLYLAGRLGKQTPVWLQMARLALISAPQRVGNGVKSGAKSAVESIYGAYALAVFGGFIGPLWLAVSLAPNRGAAARVTRFGARAMLACAGVRVSSNGGEVLGQLNGSGPWIFAPNHSSYLDVLITLATVPSTVRFVAKSEVRTMPLIGRFLNRAGHFAFDRSDSQARVKQTEGVGEALDRGESVLIFPEGTFTSAPGIRPFQLGAFKSAVLAGRPICPVSVRGAREILRDKTLLPKFGRIEVKFGPLVEPNEDAVDRAGGTGTPQADWHEIVRMRDAVREIIAENTGEPLL
jgi:1-acyl-sn-glycerol-3-phosphate acyltransferase